MKPAILYRRESTDEQKESGAGMAAQDDHCRAWAAREGYEIVGGFEDEGLSGGLQPHDRPGLMDALEALKPGYVLLVSKRDRLARGKAIVIMIEAILKKQKCRLVSAAGEGTDTDDPDDPFAFIQRAIQDMLAEYELLQTRWRTRMALRAKKRRAERTGRVPYGMDLTDDGRRSKAKKGKDGSVKGNLPIALVPNPREKAVIARMLALRSGGWTFGRIARALNDQGVTTKAGKPWNLSSVAYVCKSNRGDHHEGSRPGPDQGPQEDARRPAP